LAELKIIAVGTPGVLRAIILLIAVAAFCTGVFFLWKILLAKNVTAQPRATVTISGHSYPVEVADTLTLQAKGLAGRESLEPGHGMIFPFGAKRSTGFVMQGMRFPLDIIWVADGTIVGILKNVPPDTGLVAKVYKPEVPVDLVLEVNAGTADKDGLLVGDIVEVTYHGVR
jgi:uncharacterized membrane protein (UPF0127 family)